MLRIIGGFKIKWSKETMRLLKEGLIPTMNNTEFILVEWDAAATFEKIFHSIRELTNVGYRVICVHIER